MTNKTRRHIWPMALMSLVIFGVLAAVVALSVGGPQPASAHDCDDIADAIERATCLTLHQQQGDDHDTMPNMEPVATGSLEDVSMRVSTTSAPINVSGLFEDADGDELTFSAMSDNPNVAAATVQNGTMVIVTGSVRGSARITVTAEDPRGGMATISFTVTVSEAYTLTADPMRDPNNPSTFVVVDLGAYTAKFNLAVAGSMDDVTVTVTASVPAEGGITITDSDGLIGAGFNAEQDLEGSLTVKSTDAGSRAFEIEGECETPGAMASIEVEDKDLNPAARGYVLCLEPVIVHPVDVTREGADYSVVSYGDWAYDSVTDGFVVTDPGGPMQMVNGHHDVHGWLDRDEPVVSSYQLGVDDTEHLTQRNDPEMGQNTIEVLLGAHDVQITVTSGEEGPAYIRFLDSDMQPFGTDVDEEPMYRGADVVGLDSQGRLSMNVMRNLSAAQALAFDQYDVVVPGNPLANAYLVGQAGNYYQGAFRFFDPCPRSMGEGHHFYVEVYEKEGKYLKATEMVTCINPPGVNPSELTVTTFSDIPNTAVLSWSPATGASAHWVIVFETDTSAVVAGSLQRIEAPDYDADISNLVPNTRYTFAVLAERTDTSGRASYSDPSFIIQTMIWENQ